MVCNLSILRCACVETNFVRNVSTSTSRTDTITAVEYNADGEYLATGDRAGRITVLKLENEGKEQVRYPLLQPTSSQYTYLIRTPTCYPSAAKARELVAVFSIPKPRSRVRLLEKLRNRSENQPNKVLRFCRRQQHAIISKWCVLALLILTPLLQPVSHKHTTLSPLSFQIRQ